MQNQTCCIQLGVCFGRWRCLRQADGPSLLRGLAAGVWWLSRKRTQWVYQRRRTERKARKWGIERTENKSSKQKTELNYQQRKRTQRIRRYVVPRDCGFSVSSQPCSTRWHAAHLPRFSASIIKPGIPFKGRKKQRWTVEKSLKNEGLSTSKQPER